MKSMTFYGKKDDVLHIETPLGIVNIYVGLTDIQGRRTERVEYIPNNYAGEPKINLLNDVCAILAKEES